jgi:hypothetical protein
MIYEGMSGFEPRDLAVTSRRAINLATIRLNLATHPFHLATHPYLANIEINRLFSLFERK